MSWGGLMRVTLVIVHCQSHHSRLLPHAHSSPTELLIIFGLTLAFTAVLLPSPHSRQGLVHNYNLWLFKEQGRQQYASLWKRREQGREDKSNFQKSHKDFERMWASVHISEHHICFKIPFQFVGPFSSKVKGTDGTMSLDTRLLYCLRIAHWPLTMIIIHH